MNELEKMINGLEYRFDNYIYKKFISSRELCRKYSNSPFNLKKRKKMLEKIFNTKFNQIYIEPPLYCDFGINTSIGNNLYANFGLTILDCGKITIGDNVLIAPHVQIYAVAHPISIEKRALGDHVCITAPVNIGDNVWIGGGSIILMGVTIGNNSIIGAGSVVTQDIPANVIACGNPCKVVREIK